MAEVILFTIAALRAERGGFEACFGSCDWAFGEEFFGVDGEYGCGCGGVEFERQATVVDS